MFKSQTKMAIRLDIKRPRVLPLWYTFRDSISLFSAVS